jgi:NADPH:quinone reductase-like Zn-dependent oxidoreductase
MSAPTTSRELHSEITSDGQLKLSLVTVPLRELAANEVLVRVEAAPINPSDLGLLLGPADLATLKVENGTATATIPPQRLKLMAARLNQSMPVGNEGAGTVIAAGSEAQELLGKKVAMVAGAMFSEYRIVRTGEVLPLPDGATAAEGASAFVNPLTALAMVETLRAQNHPALVHTAAASNLGQMLNRICIADGVTLVNIVRSEEQAEILRKLGAKYIADSSAPDFDATLTAMLTETGATLAFDAIGGGNLVNRILHAMEAAAAAKMTAYSRYGSSSPKQVYIYGSLDVSPTVLDRGFGFSWDVGGFLLTPFMMKAGAEVVGRMRARVAAELTTTFASNYTAEISLDEALQHDTILAYARKATGEKFLITPAK